MYIRTPASTTTTPTKKMTNIRHNVHTVCLFDYTLSTMWPTDNFTDSAADLKHFPLVFRVLLITFDVHNVRMCAKSAQMSAIRILCTNNAEPISMCIWYCTNDMCVFANVRLLPLNPHIRSDLRPGMSVTFVRARFRNGAHRQLV